jgi:IclR family acetate operon transcriptional repressor
VDDEEDSIGYRCLAAAVLDGGGKPVAAISVMGSTMQISADNASRLATELTRTAIVISDALRAQKEPTEGPAANASQSA